jgi:hypothetical protein
MLGFKPLDLLSKTILGIYALCKCSMEYYLYTVLLDFETILFCWLCLVRQGYCVDNNYRVY